MSKNVAVFVDVANIFYAAKAAGVDIDYVTLLKAATAGRDFVRAYAYTGLDPENENQRQFHSFLSRSGYKVISKDIRKYGDGRIKANLDIELVVDLMKTARNLDIAVVVSGDGDFASAIRAVQEMGVRVEVISFRGNTSSDLIDVADQFTDIAQIARVEKGSARSGRRVAAEGDLSMTAVPEKETEGAPRRRGRARAAEERPVAVAAVAEREAQPSNVIALPGERLSRAPLAEDGADEEEPGFAAEGGADGGPESEESRRRRRRRGGRGRGRGRRGEEGLPSDELAPASVGSDDEEFDEPQPANLPHHTFGSVWDSQIGVPSAAMPPMDTLAGEPSDDEDFDEPEVPEYLLAERRQRGQGGARGGRPSGGGRNRSAYQAALDRERFGRSATPQPSFGGGGGGTGGGGGRRGPDRGRDRGRGGRPQGGDRPRYENRAPLMESRSGGSSEPWSEVPPELEQMLRAELSRKMPEPAAPAYEPAPPAMVSEPVSSAESEAPAKPTRRRTTTTRTKAAAAPAEAASDSDAPAAEAPAKASRARTTKAAATKTTTRTRKAASATTGETATKKPATRRKTAVTASEPAAETASEATEG